MWRELPPTAGMPLQWRDFLHARSKAQLPSNFEQALAQFLNVERTQVECSGTACFVIALEALKRASTRRDVIVPGYTCPLVALAIAQAGLKVKPVDTAPDSFDFDLETLRMACNQDTLCIVPTHMGGLVANLDSILDIARGTGTYVVEDAAQAFGAEWQEKKIGTISDIGFFSLTRGKGLTIYEGGVLVARDPEIQLLLEETSRQLVRQNPFRELMRSLELIGYQLFYNPIGLNFVYGIPLKYRLERGDFIEAVGDRFHTEIALESVSTFRKNTGASALRRLKDTLSANGERGRRRALILSSSSGVKVLQESVGTSGSWPFLLVLMESKEARDEALSRLWHRGLGVTRLFIHDLAGYDYLRNIVPQASLPNARSFADRLLTVSNSHWLTDEDFEEIQRAL